MSDRSENQYFEPLLLRLTNETKSRQESASVDTRAKLASQYPNRLPPEMKKPKTRTDEPIPNATIETRCLSQFNLIFNRLFIIAR